MGADHVEVCTAPDAHDRVRDLEQAVCEDLRDDLCRGLADPLDVVQVACCRSPSTTPSYADTPTSRNWRLPRDLPGYRDGLVPVPHSSAPTRKAQLDENAQPPAGVDRHKVCVQHAHCRQRVREHQDLDIGPFGKHVA